MSPLYRELQRREQCGEPIKVAVLGAGFMGRGIVQQLARMDGFRPSLIVNRSIDAAVAAYSAAGVDRHDIVVSNDESVLVRAVQRGRPAVTSREEVASAIEALDVVIAAGSDIGSTVREALACIEHRKHFVSLSGETDATFGCILAAKAASAGVVYTNADGDQPAVLVRLAEYCTSLGFEVVGAINCKGFLDVTATPESISGWAVKQNTSPRMTCAFTDGTKMNLEQNIVCNATGLLPSRRGMTGVRTDLAHALESFEGAGLLGSRGFVDYTLGGDFGAGIFVIARSYDPSFAKPYLRYLKMGDGPHYLFFRPYHLCHFETPLSAAEAVIYGQPTVPQRRAPAAHTIALAKRDLKAGDTLDGIGGYNQYGQVDAADGARGYLPIGLADGVTITRHVAPDQPIAFNDVALDDCSPLVRLWQDQERAA